MRALPQVARAEFLRSGRLLLDPARPPLVLVARDSRRARIPGRSAGATSAGPAIRPRVWVSEAVADLLRIRAGPAPRAADRWARAIRWSSPASSATTPAQHGAVLIDRADYVALTGDAARERRRAMAFARRRAAAAHEALRALPGRRRARRRGPRRDPRRVDAHLRPQLRRHLCDRGGGVRWSACSACPRSLGAIVLARRREFGVLRHLGLTRAQIRTHARRRRRAAGAGRRGGRTRGGRGDQPGAGLRREPPIVPLEHGAASARTRCCCLLTGILIVLAVLTAIVSGREATGIGPVRAVRRIGRWGRTPLFSFAKITGPSLLSFHEP